MSVNKSAKSNRKVNPLRKFARGALIGLTTELLLGMAVTRIGLPSEANSALTKLASFIFLGLHILISVGLLIVAIRIIKNSKFKILSWLGAII